VTAFPNTSLANQLKIIARLISASAQLGTKRQVFFASIGGFDLHDNLITQQPLLLAQIAGAMKSFYDATAELGVADKVTSFTASDFGRTLVANTDGSDHGWGSMHVVAGGAVQGRKLYGTAPVIADNGPDDVGQGRLLPTTSVDQYAATLATWFGVTQTDLPTVLPNIGNYNPSTRNIGFV
jgi:uncharacterized protein (DUF1501 family)